MFRLALLTIAVIALPLAARGCPPVSVGAPAVCGVAVGVPQYAVPVTAGVPVVGVPSVVTTFAVPAFVTAPVVVQQHVGVGRFRQRGRSRTVIRQRF